MHVCTLSARRVTYISVQFVVAEIARTRCSRPGEHRAWAEGSLFAYFFFPPPTRRRRRAYRAMFRYNKSIPGKLYARTIDVVHHKTYLNHVSAVYVRLTFIRGATIK